MVRRLWYNVRWESLALILLVVCRAGGRAVHVSTHQVLRQSTLTPFRDLYLAHEGNLSLSLLLTHHRHLLVLQAIISIRGWWIWRLKHFYAHACQLEKVGPAPSCCWLFVFNFLFTPGPLVSTHLKYTSERSFKEISWLLSKL